MLVKRRPIHIWELIGEAYALKNAREEEDRRAVDRLAIEEALRHPRAAQGDSELFERMRRCLEEGDEKLGRRLQGEERDVYAALTDHRERAREAHRKQEIQRIGEDEFNKPAVWDVVLERIRLAASARWNEPRVDQHPLEAQLVAYAAHANAYLAIEDDDFVDRMAELGQEGFAEELLENIRKRCRSREVSDLEERLEERGRAAPSGDPSEKLSRREAAELYARLTDTVASERRARREFRDEHGGYTVRSVMRRAKPIIDRRPLKPGGKYTCPECGQQMKARFGPKNMNAG